jgi:hypothetical protein
MEPMECYCCGKVMRSDEMGNRDVGCWLFRLAYHFLLLWRMWHQRSAVPVPVLVDYVLRYSTPTSQILPACARTVR